MLEIGLGTEEFARSALIAVTSYLVLAALLSAPTVAYASAKFCWRTRSLSARNPLGYNGRVGFLAGGSFITRRVATGAKRIFTTRRMVAGNDLRLFPVFFEWGDQRTALRERATTIDYGGAGVMC